MVAFINTCYGSLFKEPGQNNSFKFIFFLNNDGKKDFINEIFG